MIKNLLGIRDSFIPHSRVQSNIMWSRLSSVWYGQHQRENTGSRLFTEVKPCWTGLISEWVTKSTASDIEISRSKSIKSKSYKHSTEEIKNFLCNMFEFINILWSLIFIKSIRFLKFNKTDKVEQFEERSASHPHANIIRWVNYSHFTACINFFLPLDYSKWSLEPMTILKKSRIGLKQL